MIIFGGHTGNYKHFENSTYEYDVVKDAWTKLNIENMSLVPPLAYHRAVYVEELDLMVVHGGKTKPGTTAILSSNVYILNLTTMRWHVLNQRPMAFDNSNDTTILPSSNLTLPKTMAQQSICIGNSIIFFGGETEDSDIPCKQLFVINLETLEIIEYCPYQHESGLLQKKYIDKTYTELEANVVPPLYDSAYIYDKKSSNIFVYGGRLFSLDILFMVAMHVSETDCTESSSFDYWKNHISSHTLTSYLQAYFCDPQTSENTFYDELAHTSYNVHPLIIEKYPKILTSNIDKRLLKLFLKFLHGYNIIFEIESSKELVSLLECSKSVGMGDILTEWSLPYLQRLLLSDSSLDFSSGISTIPQIENLIKDMQNNTISQAYKVKHIHYFIHNFFKERRKLVAANLAGDFRLKIKDRENDIFRVDKTLLLTYDFFKTIIETPLRAETESFDEITLEPLPQSPLNSKILSCILDHVYGIDFEYHPETWPLEELLSLYVYADFYCISHLAQSLNKIIFGLIDSSNAKIILEQIGPLSDDITHQCCFLLSSSAQD
nr:unnamed protein product [Naegleria fowleri]